MQILRDRWPHLMTTIDPSDPRLVPNPVETSDEGTAWTCRVADSDLRCTGALTMSWELQEGPGDWCAVPLYSVNGVFSRAQTQNYNHDAASARYLEDKRLIHLNSETPSPVRARLVGNLTEQGQRPRGRAATARRGQKG